MSGDTRRHDPHAEGGVDALDRDLVEVPQPADIHRLDLAEPEVEEDRLLRPLVDDPPVRAGLGNAQLAPVEQVDRLFDRLGLDASLVPELVDPRLEVHQAFQ